MVAPKVPAKIELEHEEAVPIGDLTVYHRNARIGDVDKIRESLDISGQYRSICVNRGTLTGRKNEVLAGNHTLKAARSLGWDTIAVDWVDVDDEGARRIVLADNRTADRGRYDNDMLIAEISQMESFEGTGYTQEDLDKLLSAGEEEGEPADSENEEQYKNRFELVVECTDEEHQRELYQKFVDEGLTVRVLSL
jgi:ParB-like chromosome segregation protein Spo0J